MQANIADWGFSLFQHVLVTTPLAFGLILLILLIRRMSVLRLHIRIVYTLWLICIVRLWMPWTPPGPIQLWRSIQGRGASASHNEASALWTTPELRSFAVPVQRWNEINGAFNVWEILFAIWAVVMVALFLIYVGLSLYAVYTIRRAGSRPTDELGLILDKCKQELKMRRNVRIAQSNRVAYPVLSGWISPQILIPSKLIGHLHADEWRNIFLHELIHVRRGDIIWNHAMALLVIVNWFNPLMWLAYRMMREDQELSCDRVALRYTDCQQYGTTLLRVASWKLKQRHVVHGLLSFKGSSSRTLTRRRIEMIKQVVSNKRVWTPLLVGMVVIVAIMTFTGKNTTALSQELKGELSGELQQLEATDRQHELLENVMTFNLPAEGKVTREFQTELPHVSIVNVEGTAIYAAADGVVEQAEYVKKEGNYIRIAHDGGYVTTYSHLESLQVKAGEQVSAGTQIGTMGSTGNSTGPHVKWMLLNGETAIDPLGP